MIDLSFEKAKKFKFSAGAKDLDQVLARISTILGASSSQTKNYFVIAKGKKVGVLAYNQDTFCAMIVPGAKPESEGAFGFNLAALQGIIKGRAEMEFDYTGSELQFKATKGKYSGNIVTLPITTEQIAYIGASFTSAKKKDGENSALSRSMLDLLREGMVATSIKDVHTGTDMVSLITFTEKQLRVSSNDPHHFALFTVKLKEKAPAFRVALPINHFNIIDKLVEQDDKDAKFVLRPESIRVQGEGFLLVLPATQTDEKQYDLIPSYVKNVVGEPNYLFDYTNEALVTLVNNLFTLNAANTSFEISYKKDLLNVKFVTPNGSAADALKVKKVRAAKDATSVSIDPALLRDLVARTGGLKETQIGLKDKKVLVLKAVTKSGGSLTMGSSLLS